MEQKRQISSGFTFLAKVVLPSAFYLLMLTTIVASIISKQYITTLVILFVLMTFGIILYFGFVRLKSVKIDSKHLYVSNYIKTIQVPISELLEVTQVAIPGNYRPIILYLKSTSEFGDRIMFLDSMDVSWSTSDSPITDELRGIIKNRSNS